MLNPRLGLWMDWKSLLCAVHASRRIVLQKRFQSDQPDGTPPVSDLVEHDLMLCAACCKSVGDITQIDTWERPVCLATVIDLFSREDGGYASTFP